MKGVEGVLLQEPLAEGSVLKEGSGIALEFNEIVPEVKISEDDESPYIKYQRIAKFEGLEFADLRLSPCNKELLSEDLRDEYLKLNAIPWKMDGDNVVIAASAVTYTLRNWASMYYGTAFRFAITTPFDINYSVNSLFSVENSIDACDRLWKNQPQFSSRRQVSSKDIALFVGVLVAILACGAMFPLATLSVVFVLTSCFYTATMIFKSILLIIGYMAGEWAEIFDKAIDIPDEDLPIYTILMPLYKEDRTLQKLVDSIQSLDYPRNKLDVKLIVEEDDELTINAIKKLRAGRIFEMVTVPYSYPRTKPKACNYALRFARGEYITIYDAEDSPEPAQLKKVLYKFQHGGKKLACVQARLNYFNRDENLLTRMFAIEYSNLFDLSLFALGRTGIPIPLGGTSNHFRTDVLRALDAWDPYNVTEDADLGLRIYQRGMTCAVVWSLTKEEATISVWAWIKQRTRWIKGHMQTYLVHMRQPVQLYKKLGFTGFMGMQFFLGAPTLIFLISPIMWLICLLFVSGVAHMNFQDAGWLGALVKFNVGFLCFGLALQVGFAVVAIVRNGWKGMLQYSFLFPFYWILHSIASFRALWQLIRCPHYWEKTTHGVSKFR